MRRESSPADYQKAYRRTSQGRTTGPTSRILSSLSLMLVVLMLTTFLQEGLYMPVVAILVLAFTPIAPLAFLASLIYFIFIRYWAGIILIAVYQLVGWLSVRAGIRFNSRRLSGKLAFVDPFEGMPELRTAMIVQLPSLATALLARGVLSVLGWILFAVVTIFILFRYSFRLRPRWASLHYPLMLRYSAFAGMEMAQSTLESRQYSPERNLHQLIASAYPALSPPEVDQFLASASTKLGSFADAPIYMQHIATINPGLSQERREAFLAKLNAALTGPKRDAAILRYVIAEVIERDLGPAERASYLRELVSGGAT
jgi:hypothetical protein